MKIQASTSGSKTPEPEVLPKHTKDDSGIENDSWRYIDYLSHDWREEDISSSWKHVVTHHGEFPNRSRLENAAWRIWMQCKYKLRTVSPDTINWFKDYDVTWLYGPVRQDQRQNYYTDTEIFGISSLKFNPHISANSKSIMKRTVPKVIPQMPLPESCLLKKRTQLVQVPETCGQPSTTLTPDREVVASSAMLSSQMSCNGFKMPSDSVFGVASSGIPRKHIRFDETVEYFMTPEFKGDEGDDINSKLYGDNGMPDSGATTWLWPREHSPSIRGKLSNEQKALSSDNTNANPVLTMRDQKGHIQGGKVLNKMMSIRNQNNVLFLSQERCLKNSGRFFENLEVDDMTDMDVNRSSATDYAKSVGNSGLFYRTSIDNTTRDPNGIAHIPLTGIESSWMDIIFGRFLDAVNTVRDMVYWTWISGRRK